VFRFATKFAASALQSATATTTKNENDGTSSAQPPLESAPSAGTNKNKKLPVVTQEGFLSAVREILRPALSVVEFISVEDPRVITLLRGLVLLGPYAIR
jgi:hypothetical protein